MFEIIKSTGKSSKRIVRNSPALPGEIGRAYRYRVPLCIEARPQSGKAVSHLAFFPAKDMSTTGFYFVSDTPFPEHSKIDFVISAPRRAASGTVELMRGVGRCVRTERLSDGKSVRYGIGVHIESSTPFEENVIAAPKRR